MTQPLVPAPCLEPDDDLSDDVLKDETGRDGHVAAVLLTTVCVDTDRHDVRVRAGTRVSGRRIGLMTASASHVRLCTGSGVSRYLHLVFDEAEPAELPLPASLLLELAPRAAGTGDGAFRNASLVALTSALEETLVGHAGNGRLIAHIALAIRAIVPAAPPVASQPSSQPRLSEWQLRCALAIMEERFSEPLRIPDIAAACMLSQGYFARAFLASTGKTPYRWLLERRVVAAQHLLSTTQLSLTEVGLSCGFAEQSHFTRIFRKTVGTPPGTWRRSRGTLALDQADA